MKTLKKILIQVQTEEKNDGNFFGIAFLAFCIFCQLQIAQLLVMRNGTEVNCIIEIDSVNVIPLYKSNYIGTWNNPELNTGDR